MKNYLLYTELIEELEKEASLTTIVLLNLKKLDLNDAFVDYNHPYKNYIMIQLNKPTNNNNLYHIGIAHVDRLGGLTTLLFKNNLLAISDNMEYKYDSSLYFQNIIELAKYIKFICNVHNQSKQSCLDAYVSCVM
jgi:hypothetical protein